MHPWIATWRRQPLASGRARRRSVSLHLEEMECRALLTVFVPAGTFPVVPPSAPGSPSFRAPPAIADLNGDGRPDLVVANGDGVSVLLGNGDGSFQTAQNVSAGIRPAAVTVSDVNGDGRPDLVVTNRFMDTNAVSVLLGNGNGTFQAFQ